MSADRLAWCACPTEEEFWNSSGTPRTRCAIRQRQHPDLVTLKSLGQKLELRTAWFYSMHSKKPISPLHTMPSPLQMFWILTPSRGTRRGVAVKRSQPFRQRSAIDSDDAIRRRGAVPRAWRSPRPSFNRPKSRRLLLQGIMPAIVVVLLKESWPPADADGTRSTRSRGPAVPGDSSPPRKVQKVRTKPSLIRTKRRFTASSSALRPKPYAPSPPIPSTWAPENKGDDNARHSE